MEDPWLVLANSLPEHVPAKKRKKHRIVCGSCGSLMNFHRNFYTCPKCGSKHKSHSDGKPTGIPGDKETARARIEAHKVFDKLWRSGKVSRRQAYVILKRIMGMTVQEAHIGRFTYKECKHLISKLRKLGDKVYQPPYNTDGFLT
jgi:ribosomal protein S27AE